MKQYVWSHCDKKFLTNINFSLSVFLILLSGFVKILKIPSVFLSFISVLQF